MRLAISLPVRNQQALTEFLAELQDPASPNYRKFLTPAQFTARFGPTDADYQRLINYTQAHGLTVTERHPNRLIVDIDGTVANIEKVFHVTLRTYRHPHEPRNFFAPDSAPVIDSSLPILDIRGLDDFSIPRPLYRLRPANPLRPQARPQTGSGPSGTYAGGDFRAAYLPGVTLTGAGQCVALLEFDGYYAADISAYAAQFALPSVPLVNVPIDGGVSAPGSDNLEVALDIEMAMSMAPGLSAIYVYEAANPSPWEDLLNQIVNDDTCNQISCSWSGSYTPDPTAEIIFEQMAAQGQSFFTASGDYMAYTGPIAFPADSPHVTSVGATTLTTSGPLGAYQSETVWNWGDENGSYVGSSGGVSTAYSIPAWQQGISMTANLGSTTMRNMPDVAMVGDNIWVHYNNGASESVGGTSCAAPLWAAFTALVNQQAQENAQNPVGFVNASVYAICTGTGYAEAFHDITTGSNIYPSSGGRFPATQGYDLCTGWGSVGGASLINMLAVITPPVIASSNPLPAGAVATPYSETLLASGAYGPYTWAVLSGTLPSGLALAPGSGVISGVPAIAGTSAFTIQATGTNRGAASATYNIIIYPKGTPVITTSSPLTAGTAGAAYSQAFAAAGGTPPYFWALASGNVPGLSFSSTGLLSGTPSSTGTFAFSVQVTSTSGNSSTAPFSLTIPPPPLITSTLSVTATNGFPFYYQIIATGAPSGFTATRLPSGLSLNPANGRITGTPNTVAVTAATVTASNAYGTGTATLTINVVQAPPPVVSVPLVTLHTFDNSDGAGSSLRPGLLQAPDGNFYGTASGGGVGNEGTLYKFSPGGAFTLIALAPSFAGKWPDSCVTLANDGNFYGTTFAGGNDFEGSIFRLTAAGSVSDVHDFTTAAADGEGIIAGLTLAGDGNLYGGSYEFGLIYQYTIGGSVTVIYSFPHGEAYDDGPIASMVLGSDGYLYGATQLDPANYKGSVFKITTSGSLTTLHTFSGADGNQPDCNLIQANDGNFYGTTSEGGTYNDGTVFRITSQGQFTSIFSFSGTNGNSPQAGVVQGADGNLYGTTQSGGAQNEGAVFGITTSGTPTLLHSFSNHETPDAGFIQGQDGNLYGVTSAGGPYNDGIIFRMSPYLAAPVARAASYQITASNYPTSYSASGLPSGFAVNTATGLISGTPATTGTFYATISAANAGGSNFMTLPVIMLPPAPAITSASSAVAYTNVPFTYQIAASNHPVAYRAMGLPPGFSINPVTGVISGTATATGTYSGFISAIDSTGFFGNSPFVIPELVPPPAPSVTSAATATGTAGLPFNYQITARNNPTTYSVTGLPTGLSVDPAAGAISGTVATPGTFSAVISAANVGGTGTAPLVITIKTAFGAWQNRWFTPGQLSKSTVSGDMAEPAGDGIANLLKYALNLNPWLNGNGGLPIAGMATIGGSRYLTLTYTEMISSSDLTYIPEVSGDLETWYSGPGYIGPVSVTPNGDGVTQTVIVQDLTPEGPAPRFMRLRVSGP